MKKLATIILILVILFALIAFLTRKPQKAVSFKPVIKGRIAIVLDDWGYNLNNLRSIEEIKYPLTASILPNIAYTRKVAEELHSRGFEVILHLPMEPEEKLSLEKNTIKTSMEKTQILNILDSDLSSIAYADGVSNHMGSKATSDLKTMEVIFKELKNRHLYFLDSFVTSKSVCSDLARKIGLRSFTRDVFLDNLEEREYIKQQIYKLKAKARAKGFAIGIGHDRKVTLEVLREVMPQIAKEGYKFVFLSELSR
ncbi:MAG: divergent polysaccharide deacetylase family protein [Candidatus Omnitrophota bacterium]|nr:divergent polysaccharide deacetylase family protein [Candidatus Omnitrophota bacterium]